MKHCPECGKEVKEGIKFCGACGSAIKIKDSSAQIVEAVDQAKETVKDLANSPQVTEAVEKMTPAVDKAKSTFDTSINYVKNPEATIEGDVESGSLTNGLIFTAIAVMAVILTQIIFVRGVINATASAVGGATQSATDGFFDAIGGGGLGFGSITGGAAQSATAGAMNTALPTGTIVTTNLFCALIAILGFWLAGVLFSKISKNELNAKQVFVIQGYAAIPYVVLLLIAAFLLVLGGMGTLFGLIVAALASMVFFFCYFALLSRQVPQVSIMGSSVFAITVSVVQTLVIFILFAVISARIALNAATGILGAF